MKAINHILTVALISFFVLNAQAQDIGKILSPKPNDTILNGELFIIIEANHDLKIKPSKLNLTIDQLNYTTLVKYSNNKISALIFKPLKQGRHEIALFFTKDNKEIIAQKWTFYIYGENKMKRKFPNQWEKHKQVEEEKNFGLKGSFSLRSKLTELSGEGADLRQEPPQSQNIYAIGNARFKEVSFPFKFRYTNHENPLKPPRNRMMFGVKSDHLGILIGDVSPKYNKMILNGTRIRGAEAFVKFMNTKISIVHGEINRLTEGTQEYWDINQGFQPVNIQSDSSYIIPGTYKRNLSAFNLETKPANSENKFGLTVLQSTDDVTSIQFGGPAEQNLAMSLNWVAAGRNNRYFIDMGMVLSATTKDIRKGAIDPEEFQSTYNKELRVDPQGWEKIFIVNSTTIPTTTQNYSFFGWYFNSRFNILKQKISLNLKRLGGGFESFGNPYLQSDRRELMFRDHISFWKRNINLSLQYRYVEDNLSNIKALTNFTQMMGSRLSLALGPKSPKLIGAYRLYLRKSIWEENSEIARNTFLTNYSAGINHNFKTGDFTHAINVIFVRNIRENILPQKSENKNNNINFSLNETFPFGLTLSVNYNHLLLANDTSELTEQQTLGFRLSFTDKKKKLRVSIGGRQISALETNFPESIRQIADITIQYKVLKNAQIKLQLGNSTYNEIVSNEKNYNENWGQLSLRYQLR